MPASLESSSPQPVNRLTRTLRYAGIAFSAVSGVVCLLLICFWVRSYWWDDHVDGPWDASQRIRLSSCEGWLTAAWLRNRRLPVPWRVRSDNLQERYEGYEKFLKDSRGTGTIHHRIPKFGFHGALFQLPYWFVTTIAATSLLLPWLPYRFSLRTLLIAITLVAAFLGLVVWLSS